MDRHITASFASQVDAEAAQERLLALGVAADRIRMSGGESEQAGFFDKLGEYIAPGRAARAGAYQVQADVPDATFAAATAALTGSKDDAVATAADPFIPRTYEAAETAEVLTVEKELAVREEVVLAKSVETRVEQIDDVVRRTEVEVERLPRDEPGTQKRLRTQG